MGLLEKLKSAIGLDASGPQAGSGAAETGRQNVDVTVEHEPEPPSEPDTESEDAVKGTGELDRGGAVTEVEPASESETERGSDAEPEETGDGSVSPSVTDAAEPVDSLKGIGPAYAEKLSGIGVETVGDLVETGAETIAAETDISEKRVARWIDRASESDGD